MVSLVVSCRSTKSTYKSDTNLYLNEEAKQEITDAANKLLLNSPITITSFKADRSAGGVHDYYSEGAYWWPDSENPNGPYIRKDGYRNPENFNKHSNAVTSFGNAINTLTAAYILTGKKEYAVKAIDHLDAWYVNPTTSMNPSLLYAQAIKGINTGRGIGIIDVIEFIDVAMASKYLSDEGQLKGAQKTSVEKWFSDFGTWLTTHPYGIEEQNNNNNHSTWWGAQLAAYARASNRVDLLKIAQTQYKNQLDIQMETDGSFPDELGRTRPFHYTNYNLDAWALLALLGSDADTKLAAYESKNGNLRKSFEYLNPFIARTTTWSHGTSLEPVITPHRANHMIYASWLFNDKEFGDIWLKLPSGDKASNGAAILIMQNVLK